MAPNQFPASLPDFQAVFPDETACARYLETLRWPDGFTCPKCKWHGEPYRFATMATTVLGCRGCKARISLTAGTVMQWSKIPLMQWFWGAYLMTTQTPGQSALQFQRQIGIKTYETAFQMLHKLRAGMVRPERDEIGGEYPVEVDECLVGGRTKGEGRGVHHKATVVGAVEVRRRKDAEERAAKHREAHADGIPLKKIIYAGRLRLRMVDGRGAGQLTTFISDNVAKGSTVRTDGWVGYEGLTGLGYEHDPLVLKGDAELTDAHLPMIHIVFSNLKTWLLGTHHGVSQTHLQAYLNEYVFRFNRRFYPMVAFNSVLGIGARVVPPTYAALYSGEWQHPA